MVASSQHPSTATQVYGPDRTYSFQALQDREPGTTLEILAQRVHTSPKVLKHRRKVGLDFNTAEAYAAASGLRPWEIWPDWLADDSLAAHYDPTPPPQARYIGKRYRPGGLTAVILEIAASHLGEPISPSSVAHEMGRGKHTVMVSDRMKMLAAPGGRLEVCNGTAQRYVMNTPLPADHTPSETFLIPESSKTPTDDTP